MLIAAVRTGHALAGKAITYSDEDGTFLMTGAGEIPAAQLIAYDERRQLDWADAVTREWALEMAAVLVRKQAAVEQKLATEAAAAAAEAARLEALAPPSVVYLPPDTTPPRPEGIPAVAPRFELASEARDRPPRWVVWAEAAPASGQAVPPGQAARGAPGAVSAWPAPADGATPTAAPETAAAAQTQQSAQAPAQAPAQPLAQPLAPPPTPTGPTPASRRDRIESQRGGKKRGRKSHAGLRIVAYVLAGAAAAAALYVAQRGGF